MLKMRVNNNMQVETEMVTINSKLAVGIAVDNDSRLYLTIQEHLDGVTLRTVIRGRLEMMESLRYNLCKSVIGNIDSDEYEDLDIKMTMVYNTDGGNTKQKKTVSGIGTITIINGIGGNNTAVIELFSDTENMKHVFNVNRQISRQIINIANHVMDEIERYTF